ncbi:unnamed protein product [Mytilus coruscus]|uniref:C-type lectin domain-containing protein n=1 Tax=Mytilus coruscus TaxID=42192 RepID=A0A6J8B7G5_MYTCO|nr:unnamed protein product [Mytilus coruscus]
MSSCLTNILSHEDINWIGHLTNNHTWVGGNQNGYVYQWECQQYNYQKQISPYSALWASGEPRPDDKAQCVQIWKLETGFGLDDHDYCEISLEEVFNVLKCSTKGGSLRYDKIPVELYKNQTLLKAIARVFNVCFNSGKVPVMWSNGIITPIPKSSTSDPSDPLSYCGIILASVSYKLYCGVLNSHLTYKLDEIDFLCDEQNSYRKWHSTVSHLSTQSTIIETGKLRN